MKEKSKDIIDLGNKSLTKPKGNVKKGFRKYWDKEYINKCIDQIQNPKHRVIIKTLWYTGMRVSEVINIKKKDIDLENYTIRIKWLKNRKYQERIIPMHPDLQNILQFFIADLNKDERLFQMSRQRVYQITKKYLKGSPHQIRHSFAVNWLRNDGDLVQLKRMLGHSHINATMEYLRIVPKDIGKQLLKIDFR